MKVESKNWIAKITVLGTVLGVIGGLITIYDYYNKSLKKYPKLDGTWTVAFTVQESSYNPYINDVYVYELYVTQNEKIINGKGEQKLYNGAYARKHFKFEFNDIDVSDRLNISYILYATREVSGIMTLNIDKNDSKHLIGTFHGSAANVKGLVDIKIK